jgi:hypothetical protein
MTRARLVPTSPLGLRPLELDVTISISDEESATIANHPVEEGPVLSDEVSFDPRVLSVELIFLDIAPTIAGVAGPSRGERLLADLRGLYRAKARLTLVVPDAPPIEDLVLRKIGTRRDRATGAMRPVSIDLQRIEVLRADIVEAVLDSDVLALGGLSSVDMGLLP